MGRWHWQRAASGTVTAGQPEPRDERLPRIFVPTAPGVSLPTDVALTRQLEAAYDYIRQESWAQATNILHALLDLREDVLVGIRRTGAGGKVLTSCTSVRSEANRLLDQLPARGREFYETTYGPQAKALLAEASSKGDMNLLAEVARRYYHIPAGVDATRLLGLYHLDRGRYHLAAMCFGRLHDLPNAQGLPPATLFASAVAFRLTGNERRAEQAWTRLAAKHPSGLRRGNQHLSLQDLQKEFARLQPETASPHPLPAGGGEGGVRGAAFQLTPDVGPAPLLEARWTKPATTESITREWVQAAVQREEDRSPTILPPSVPITVTDRVIYRTYNGIQAVDRATGKLAWESPSEWGLDRMVRELRFQPYVNAWLNGYAVNNPHLVFANETLGTLSTDGTRVYAVEDLAIPPFPLSPSNTIGGRGRRGPFADPNFGPDLTDPAHHSRLLALDVVSGKVVWEIGGRGKGLELNDCYFLGPPLPLDDRLYGIVEKNQELRLVCLDAASGVLHWSQALAVPSDKLLRDVGRRVQPLRLSYQDGILVCPTHAGVVLGLDLFHRSLAWAHAYRDEFLPPDGEPLNWGRRGRYVPRDLPRLREDWKAAIPIIHGDRVVLTAPDAPMVQCLDLHSGAPRWKTDRRDDDLYLAGVFGGKILIVGRQNCRALGLNDGRLVWTVDTGLPSGRGMEAGGAYYLPLKSALPSKQPAIYAIDLDRGTILTRTPAPKGDVPGNLILWGEDLLSQTVTALTAYARLKSDKDQDK
jgi:outer membrane protein assembly factor BamB